MTPTLAIGEGDAGADVIVVATREQAIDELVRRGLSEDEIADRLHFAETGQVLFPL